MKLGTRLLTAIVASIVLCSVHRADGYVLNGAHARSLSHFAFTNYGNDGHAFGIEGELSGRVPAIGIARVTFSASFDSEWYANSPACLLVNTETLSFPLADEGPLDATATVEITKNSTGDKLFASIAGGSYCGIQFPGCFTADYSLTFVVTGGTGRYHNATGHGVLHFTGGGTCPGTNDGTNGNDIVLWQLKF